MDYSLFDEKNKFFKSFNYNEFSQLIYMIYEQKRKLFGFEKIIDKFFKSSLELLNIV